MLSFKSGRPIAIIKGGKYNGKIVYVQNLYDNDGNTNTGDDFDDDEPFDYTTLLSHPVFQRMKKRQRMKEYDRIYRILNGDVRPRKDDELLREVLKIKNNKMLKDIKLGRKGKMVPIPNPDRESTNYYTAGANGSGKSYNMGDWMRQYKKLFPKNKIYLFKRNSRPDPAFKGIKFVEMDHEELVEDPLELEDLENCLLVFDDTARIRDKRVRELMNDLMLDALENGRKLHCSVACSNHLVADNKNTKIQLYESDILVVFPGSANAQISYVAKKYVGMDAKAIQKMLHLKSRWVLISKSYPQYVMYVKGVYIL